MILRHQSQLSAYTTRRSTIKETSTIKIVKKKLELSIWNANFYEIKKKKLVWVWLINEIKKFAFFSIKQKKKV